MKLPIALGAALALALTLFAGEGKEKGKEVTLEGTGMCAKCSLSMADNCTNALQVKGKDGKTATYLFTANMKHGKYFCKGSTPNLVVKGKLVEKDGKLMLQPSSVEPKGES